MNEIKASAITSFILGRPWQKEPRTVFIRCEEPAALSPGGWSTWNVTPALYAEYQCYGPCADTSSRINISRQLTDEEALDYTIENIFSAESNPRYAFDWMPENIVISAVGDEKESDDVPMDYGLLNYPNPFNPVTKIAYTLPKQERVEIVIYNLLGEQLMTIVDKKQLAGRYEVQINADRLPSGVYFYSIQAGNFKQTRKMMLLNQGKREGNYLDGHITNGN